MKLTNISIVTALLFAQIICGQEPPNQQNVAPEYMKPAGSRKFSIEYNGKISEVPEGTKKLRVWFPVPQNSTAQTITDLSFSKSPSYHTETKYGNLIGYWEIDSPQSSHEFTMRFTCERKEIVADLAKLSTDGSAALTKRQAEFLAADKLVLVDDEMRKLAAEVTKGKTTTLEKARAIYDHVLGRMTYDKNHQGWGLGSTRHACDVGKGNCTDFHALFNSLCRASGIPSGFEIGLYLPYEKGKDEPLGGYHCWAFFLVRGKSWVPVDCSEADRFPQRAEYFFGSHTPNRVTLTTGRDITLAPEQSGAPLNYFLNPYAEADGKSVKTEKTWTFRDL
ncbi:MAG TPA: transglutaminase domain-containing protein [Verrucomicrobiae bacterium]